MANEKFILTRRELHFGHAKETFRAGAVIEVDEVHGKLIVDGRHFPDIRDVDILKRQAEQDPDNAWIVPYSKAALEEIRNSQPASASKPKKPRPGEGMKIVQSDEDLMDTDIDISDTQVSKIKAAEKLADKAKVKKNGMEVIRGDETVEERIAALKGKSDISSMSERVRLKATGSARMPVVRDDSLGSVAGSKGMSMNAGQALPSRAEVEAKTDGAKATAAARKKEVDALRAKTASEASELDAESSLGGGESEGSQGAPEGVSGGDTAVQRENAELKAKIAKLEALAVAGAVKRGPGRPRKVQKVG